MDDLKKIQERVAVFFPSLFKAGFVHLWINNSLTGFMQTYTKESQLQQCFPGKGIFQDVIRGKQPINMKNQIQNRYLYLQMNTIGDNSSTQAVQTSVTSIDQYSLEGQQFSSLTQSYSCQSSFCLPIIMDDEVIGILEASDSSMPEGFGMDEELFAVVCANYLTVALKKIKTLREQAVMLKYSDILLDCFQQCIESENLLALEKRVQMQLVSYFGVRDCRFYFTDFDENPQHFYSLLSKNKFSIDKGVIGEALSLLHPVLTNQIHHSANYDPFVDIKTILPTLTIPLVHQLEKDHSLQCFGVIQVPLKKRTPITKEKDELLLGSTPLLGLDKSLENMLKSYSKLITQAVKFIKSRCQIPQIN